MVHCQTIGGLRGRMRWVGWVLRRSNLATLTGYSPHSMFSLKLLHHQRLLPAPPPPLVNTPPPSRRWKEHKIQNPSPLLSFLLSTTTFAYRQACISVVCN